MFQFPGFALFVLCVQTKSTWFNRRSSAVRATRHNGRTAGAERLQTADNRRLSGGFPHSDIPGSKGALASSGLIAECHVLHRLLLPRHPPNALIALDPIQKKTGPFARGMVRPSTCPCAFCPEVEHDPCRSPGKEAPAGQGQERRISARPVLSVSVFRLGKTASVARRLSAPDAPRSPLGPRPKASRVLLSQRCQLPRSQRSDNEADLIDPLCVPFATSPGWRSGGSRRS